jgi:nicotinamidase-related amidase
LYNPLYRRRLPSIKFNPIYLPRLLSGLRLWAADKHYSLGRKTAMDTALLVIDVQQALCFGEYKAFESERVIERINTVARKMRIAGAPVVMIQHESQGEPLAFETEGWRLASGLETLPTDIFLRKKATDSFHQTNLHELLQERGIKNLVICGFQSDFCVDTTTRRALALGYPVVLVSDAHSTLDNNGLSAAQISAHHNETLANISSFGPRVKAIPASEVSVDA